PKAFKRRRQLLANQRLTFVRAGAQGHQKTRMVIRDGQWIASFTVRQAQIALEVHLPQLVGFRHFKARMGPMFLTSPRIQLPMPSQDFGDGALRRDVRVATVGQPPFQFPPTPGRMSSPRFQHPLLHRLARAPWTVQRSPRLFHQSCWPLPLIALQPFVARLAADPIRPTQRAHVRPCRLRLANKFFFQSHHTHFLPGHRPLSSPELFDPLTLPESVTHVSEPSVTYLPSLYTLSKMVEGRTGQENGRSSPYPPTPFPRKEGKGSPHHGLSPAVLYALESKMERGE